MKAGTATKLVLNTLTTAAMVRTGKTYGNLMVDLVATNAKLQDRSERIVMSVTGVSRSEAARLLRATDGHVKTALLMYLADVDAGEARRRLSKAGGHLRDALAR
jgi:N-acetylmuramic acid 6-phosphate etherase